MKRPEWMENARDILEGFIGLVGVPVVMGTVCGLGLGCMWGAFKLVVFLIRKVIGG